nr:3309_t:CDS:1 [Entrophospora candida]
MLSKSFKSLAFALLIIMIFSNAFIYASPSFEEKRDSDSLEKRVPPPDIGKAAFARFGANKNDKDKVKGIITFVEEFDVNASYRLLITAAVFSDGFKSSNINDYKFLIGTQDVTNVFSFLSISPPRAKFTDCTFSINGLRVRDIVGKQFTIKLNNEQIGRDKISAY